jgi:hypothetical protein
MTPEETAAASAGAVSAFTSRFMLDAATYVKGGELGFDGMQFYAGGRGGALGDVDADVVAAAFVFFNPEIVRPMWEGCATVMTRVAAAEAFAACGHEWGRAHLPDDVDAARLAALARKVAAAASPAGAPVFAGWRALPAPDDSDAKAAAVHHMNSLRELRNAYHGAAVLAQGIAPCDAVRFKSPAMAALFGWPDPLDEDAAVAIKAGWEAAEEATNEMLGKAFAVLDDGERAELVTLANAASKATA